MADIEKHTPAPSGSNEHEQTFAHDSHLPITVSDHSLTKRNSGGKEQPGHDIALAHETAEDQVEVSFFASFPLRRAVIPPSPRVLCFCCWGKLTRTPASL
jgi:hypothetical protein